MHSLLRAVLAVVILSVLTASSVQSTVLPLQGEPCVASNRECKDIPSFDQSRPAGEAATGIRGRYGTYVEATSAGAPRTSRREIYEKLKEYRNKSDSSAPTSDALAPAPAPAQQPEPIEADSSCGPTGGKALVVIPEPNLDKLNVRARPGGRVLATIPEGTEVSIVGACGSEAAAGFLAPKENAAAGWCQIDAPVSGCVLAKYLQLGGSDGAADAAGLLRGRARHR